MSPALRSFIRSVFVLFLGLLFLGAAVACPAHAAKKATSKKSSHVSSSKKAGRAASATASKKKVKKGARATRRRGGHRGPLREVRPDFPEPPLPGTAPEGPAAAGDTPPLPTPTTQPAISRAVVDALARGSVSGAILAMREEPISPKLGYLNRQASRIVAHQMDKKVDAADAHRVYQNLGISYHNLYLFLKARGIEQRSFAKEAERFYRKARRAATELHRADGDLLRAALLASAGKKTKAAKIYRKIDEKAVRHDFDAMEYLAAYHAAAGNVEGALAALDAAYRLNRTATLTWLAVGDDFDAIAAEPQFKTLMIAWKAEEASKNLKRSLPKAEKKRSRRSADDGAQFRPQKSTPHYQIKKPKGKKKPASAKAKRRGKKK